MVRLVMMVLVLVMDMMVRLITAIVKHQQIVTCSW